MIALYVAMGLILLGVGFLAGVIAIALVTENINDIMEGDY